MFTFFILFFASLKTLALLNAILFTVIFITATILHNKVISLNRTYKKWLEIKKDSLARINLDWENIPEHKIFSSKETEHLELDLDLTGKYSLHRLIDSSKSREGSLLLRKLLIETPQGKEEILHRQNLVKELLGLSHFRNKFLLVSALASKDEFSSDFMREWFKKPNNHVKLKNETFLLFALAVINLVLVVLAILGILPGTFLISSLIYFAAYNFMYNSIKSSSADADMINDQMKKIIGILSLIESYRFGSQHHLKKLCSTLTEGNSRPSDKLNQINKVLSVLAMRSNPFLWFTLMMIFPIDYYLAYRVEVLKKSIALNLPAWLDTWHKVEVYVSIANFAFLNPEYTFPEIIDTSNNKSKLMVKTEEIGHPLIPYETSIKNNFTIDSVGKIALLTGSNMAGKSTFLRTIGTNCCLANIGAPVNAKLFKTTLTRMFACIKVSDSVTDGISYFYAEVKRLKNLLDEIEAGNDIPMLYFIDEIFKGTNNIERHKGSRAILKALLNKNGSGLISTHDLELVKLADEFPNIINYHFREEVSNGTMIFDYKLRQGPCPTTNALKIMKMAGLPIE